jgi:hypothetical protein
MRENATLTDESKMLVVWNVRRTSVSRLTFVGAPEPAAAAALLEAAI